MDEHTNSPEQREALPREFLEHQENKTGDRKKNVIVIAVIVAAVAAIGGWYMFGGPMTFQNGDESGQESDGVEQAFARDDLRTNTAKRSIELNQVLDGGPGKDGIPAINEPKFISVADAADGLNDETLGILVTVEETSRFYPYTIMNWHEVVNDTIEGKPLAVTFCPLCGSAIVFDANVNGEILRFGVSGKLYESNLLMYDTKTESLWSQSRGEAVVGDMLGTKLTIFSSQVLPYAQVRERYVDAQVLSRDTGYDRNYDFDPYSGYESSDDVLFPVSVRDNRFPAKEIFYIVPVGDKSVAFKLKDLREDVEARVNVDGTELVAITIDGEIQARLNGQGEPLPSYVEMWFSWAIHHQENGFVWQAGQ